MNFSDKFGAASMIWLGNPSIARIPGPYVLLPFVCAPLIGQIYMSYYIKCYFGQSLEYYNY